ncbi:MAG: peptidyl-prolyl cis-trans isomerase [Desulfobulbaceae bacterium]|nr:peptidyl-prolyl cis-trans isomerase [Desulfobulbaceae bacterium]
MKNCFFSIIVFCGLIILPYYLNDAHGDDNLPEGAVVEDLVKGKAQTEAVSLPGEEEFIPPGDSFFSPPYDDTPVAMVDDEPITKYDLSAALARQGKEMSDDPEERKKEYLDVLDRLVNSRLIVLEAMNIGLHETREVTSQVESFKLAALQQELIQNHLHGLEPDPAEVEELYQKMSREVKLYSLVFPAGPEARRFLDEVKEGDFEQIAEKYIEEGRATEQEEEEYVKIKDLRPEVGQEVYSMDVGGLSKIYLTEDGYLLYKLVDARFVEDESVREKAVSLVTEKARTDKAREYGTALQEKYVTFDEELYEQLDFDADFEQLLQDKRVLARAKREDAPPFVVTVADLAARIKAGFFHGADKAAKLKIIDERKKVILSNMIFTYTSELEAQHLGLDQTEDFKRRVEDFERSTIFNAFMNRVLLPEVKVTEEEIRAYYDEHIDEFSSSPMLRMKSLVFNNRQDAESALDKLRKGADYNWVSANAANMVAPDTEGVLPLDRNLLSLTALPEDLHEAAEDAKKGDSLVYAPSEGDFFYLLLVEDFFPPESQPYEQARAEAGQKVFNIKVEKVLDEWVSKLKEAYAVQILLNDSGE